MDTGMIYGLGEHRARLLHNASAMWQQYVMWSRDQPPSVCISTKYYVYLTDSLWTSCFTAKISVFVVLSIYLSSVNMCAFVFVRYCFNCKISNPFQFQLVNAEKFQF